MRARSLRPFVVILALSVLAGCALVASKSEYARFRSVRLARDQNERLVAMQRYMAEHPNGAWAKGVQAERVHLEPGVWETSRSTREGLEFYLAAFPDGPHAEEAAPRLEALTAVQGRRVSEQERARDAERERRAALEEQRRTWLTRASQFWTRTMIGITNWGSPIADVARQNPEFSRAFGQNPAPRCSRAECIKFYRSDYAIPVPGSTRIERSLELLLRLRMVGGNVERAELLLPNKGFSRWFEQENRSPVIDEDFEQRQQAIEWALGRILPVIREAAPGAQPADVVPEPIDPPTVRAPNQPDPGAALAPGDEPAESPAPGPAPQAQGADAPPQTPQQQGGLDDLIRRAAGDDEQQQGNTRRTPAPATPAEDVDTMVLPIALHGFTAGRVRIVIFAAAQDDYGAAYDGMFIEHVR